MVADLVINTVRACKKIGSWLGEAQQSIQIDLKHSFHCVPCLIWIKRGTIF